MLNRIVLKVICCETNDVFDLHQSWIDNEKTIYSKSIDVKIKTGDKIIKTMADGHEQCFKVTSVNVQNKFFPTLVIQVV